MRRPFTEQEIERLDYLIRVGWGWRKYAESVKAQGWISDRQAVALDEMYCKVYTKTEQRKILAARPKYNQRNTYKRHMGDSEGWGEMYESADYGGYEDTRVN